MSDLTKSLESLSPKKRALLEVLRKEQRADRWAVGCPVRGFGRSFGVRASRKRLRAPLSRSWISVAEAWREGPLIAAKRPPP